MEVLLLSKTRYGDTQVCIGGICLNTKQFIRLLNPGGFYQPIDTPFNIGDIWDITFTINSNRKEPHNEDVTIEDYKFVKKIYQLESFIKNLDVPIWRDNISNIFEGKILWQRNGKGYFSENVENYPSHSVGFWIADIDLNYSNGYYHYENNGVSRQIIYKGSQIALPVISKGKLLRLSLAKWWKPEGVNIESRCYLQLSGWYEDKADPKIEIVNNPVVTSQPVLKRIVISNPISRNFDTPISNNKPKNTKGPCYIATLCYNDYFAEEVCVFRDFRDMTLSKSKFGRKFILFYYQSAPKIASKLEKKKVINIFIKYSILNPLLYTIKLFNLDKNK
jgi:hypothetical protein